MGVDINNDSYYIATLVSMHENTLTNLHVKLLGNNAFLSDKLFHALHSERFSVSFPRVQVGGAVPT